MREQDQRVQVRGVGRERRDAIGRVGVAARDPGGEDEVLGHPHRLEAERLGVAGDGRRALGAEAEEGDADLHADLPSRRSTAAIRSRSRCFWTFPLAVAGSSSISSSR